MAVLINLITQPKIPSLPNVLNFMTLKIFQKPWIIRFTEWEMILCDSSLSSLTESHCYFVGIPVVDTEQRRHRKLFGMWLLPRYPCSRLKMDFWKREIVNTLKTLLTNSKMLMNATMRLSSMDLDLYQFRITWNIRIYLPECILSCSF